MSTVTQQGISPVLEGQVYRVGDVVQQIMTLRYMQLFEDGIVQHQSKQSMLEGHQGKVFSLDGSCTLSTVREEELLLRPEGVGTLQAMVVRDLEKKLVVHSC